MSFVKDLVTAPFKIAKNLIGGFTGETAAEATQQGTAAQLQAIREARAAQEAGIEQGQEFLAPFGGIGQQGVEQAGFLTDPQAQFEFLQSNPLFQLALENANVQTQKQAAARGRLSAGDTLQQLSQNVLLSASPLIQQQKASIGDLLNIGTGVAGRQANLSIGGASNIADLITSGGATQAAGFAGEATARGQGAQNILQSALLAGSVFGG